MVPRKPDWRSYTCNRHVETCDLTSSLIKTRTTDVNSREPVILSCARSSLLHALLAYLVVPAAVPGQPRTTLKALPTGGAPEACVALLVDPLVVPKEASQPEGLAAGRADVSLLLCVDSHVVAQCHVVGVGFVTKRTVEVAYFVCVLVVEKTASVLVRAAAKVAGKRAFFTFRRPYVARLHANVGAVEGG